MDLGSLLSASLAHFFPLFLEIHSQLESTATGHIPAGECSPASVSNAGEGSKDRAALSVLASHQWNDKSVWSLKGEQEMNVGNKLLFLCTWTWDE